jgi:hypothetical protein
MQVLDGDPAVAEPVKKVVAERGWEMSVVHQASSSAIASVRLRSCSTDPDSLPT